LTPIFITKNRQYKIIQLMPLSLANNPRYKKNKHIF